MTHGARAAVLAAVAITCRARSGRAAVLFEDSLGGSSATAGMVLRAFQFGLEGAVLEPPRLEIDASPSSLSLLNLRPYVTW